MTDGTLSQDQVLDELERLAALEHAWQVEVWTVCAALGFVPHTGPATGAGREAAIGFHGNVGLAFTQLGLVSGLFDGVRPFPGYARADRVTGPDGTEISLAPPTFTTVTGLLDRERAIAAAIDAGYRSLDPSARDAGLGNFAQAVVDQGQTHTSAAAALADALAGAGDEVLLATRRAPDGPSEQALLDEADRVYAELVTTFDGYLRDRLGADGGTLRMRSLELLRTLDARDIALAPAGLLPAFTSGPGRPAA